jgi:hypothetical protein
MEIQATFNQQPAEKLLMMFEALYQPSGSKDVSTVVTLHQEDYKVLYHLDKSTNVIEINSIDGHTDIEFTYTSQFLFKVEEEIRKQMIYKEEYKGEMMSDESRYN